MSRAGWRLRRGLAGLALAMFSPVSAQETPSADELLEERIFFESAQDEVAITATFSGEELFVFGAIARNRFLTVKDAPPELAIVIQGPSTPVMVRRKARVAGVWMNTEAIRIAAAPSFYAVASSKPLPEILRDSEDNYHRISLDRAVLILGIPNSAQDPELFRQALIRLRRRDGLYQEQPAGVHLKSGTLYQTLVPLPANIVEGDYEIRVYLLRDGLVRDQAQVTIPVRRRGVERALYIAAQDLPFIYGLGTLVTALLAGYGASELFRRLKS